MTSTYRKKLIEVALPLPEINDASSYDKMPGIGPHPKGIHHWWARLPLPTARAVLFASVVTDPSDDPAWRNRCISEQDAERERLFGIVRRLMWKKLHEHPEVYAEARAEMLKHCDGCLPPVLDPFAGGGSIPLEAARLGFAAQASDLNPVAVLLNRCNLELAPRWAGHPPINPADREGTVGSQGWQGTHGLAADVRYFGRLIRARALEKLGMLYPRVRLSKDQGGGEVNVIAWLWARTVKCSNPACGARTPMIRSFWLARKKPTFVYAHPALDRVRRTVQFEIRSEGEPEKETTSGKGARCLFCETSFGKQELRRMAMEHGVGLIPFAVVTEGTRGRVYLPSTAVALPQVEPPDIPQIDQPMTNDRRWFSPPLYGLPNFTDLFTPRQLVTLSFIADSIRTLREEVHDLAVGAGMAAAEAVDYARTVITFLGLALDRTTDFSNALARWSPTNQKVMNLFGRQAIPMVWDFAETNTLSNSVGAWQTCSDYVSDCIEVLVAGNHGIGRSSHVDAAIGKSGDSQILVSTDPPYYDNIGYAALSDFFSVWLHRSVGDLHRPLFDTLLVPKMQELTASPGRFDGDKQVAKEHFETGFRQTFLRLRDRLAAEFPLTVYYAFKQEDEENSDDEQESGTALNLTTGWETLLEALVSSGFTITATWPVRASQKWRMVSMGTNALASYIVLACRPRPESAPMTSRADLMKTLKRELPDALRKLQQGNIAPVDLAQAAIGPGMAVFSRYPKVVEADGKAMSVRTALGLINQMLDEVLAEQEGEFDSDTRWALAWFEQFAFETGAFGMAETLSKAKNTSVAGLVESGFLEAKSGKVRLLQRPELSTTWDPRKDERLTIWEVTQHLIHTLESKGEPAAGALLRLVGGVGETARDLAYRLYTLCERKKWAEEARAYNGLVIAWPELQKLAARAPEAAKADDDLFGGGV